MLDEMDDLGQRYSTERAAEIIGISPSTLASWRGTPVGPKYQKIGSQFLYPEKWIIEYLRSTVVDPADAVKGGSQ